MHCAQHLTSSIFPSRPTPRPDSIFLHVVDGVRYPCQVVWYDEANGELGCRFHPAAQRPKAETLYFRLPIEDWRLEYSQTYAASEVGPRAFQTRARV